MSADPSQYPLVGELLPAHTMHNQPNISAGQIWDALVEADGNVAAAARALDLSRTKLQERIDRNPDLITLLSDMREEVVDVAETNQFRRAKSGVDPRAEQFVLSTLGKRRGWSTAAGGINAGGDITVHITQFATVEDHSE